MCLEQRNNSVEGNVSILRILEYSRIFVCNFEYNTLSSVIRVTDSEYLNTQAVSLYNQHTSEAIYEFVVIVQGYGVMCCFW